MRNLLAALVSILAPSLFAGQDATGVKHALLVGVQDYKGTGLGNLKYCENDVHALADLLPTLGYAADNVILLTRKLSREKDNDSLRPTAINIRKWLANICREAKANDSVLIAFAGHGLQLKATDKMYFCPLESNLEKSDTLISLDEIYKTMENDCKAAVKVLLVDACRNDPLDGRRVAPDDRVQSLSRPQIPDPPGGIAAFFSCSKAQTAFESDTLKHGIFFSCVIDALSGKAANAEGEVTIPLLEDYLARNVPKMVKTDTQNPEIQQVPERRGTLRGSGILLKIILRKSDTTASVPNQKSPVKEAPEISNLDVVAELKQLIICGRDGIYYDKAEIKAINSLWHEKASREGGGEEQAKRDKYLILEEHAKVSGGGMPPFYAHFKDFANGLGATVWYGGVKWNLKSDDFSMQESVDYAMQKLWKMHIEAGPNAKVCIPDEFKGKAKQIREKIERAIDNIKTNKMINKFLKEHKDFRIELGMKE